MSVASSVSEPISSQMLAVLVDKQNEDSEAAILAAGSLFDDLFGIPLEQLAMPSIPQDRDKEAQLASLASKRIIEVVAQKILRSVTRFIARLQRLVSTTSIRSTSTGSPK